MLSPGDGVLLVECLSRIQETLAWIYPLHYIKLGIMALGLIPVLRMERPEELEFNIILGYVVNSRLA